MPRLPCLGCLALFFGVAGADLIKCSQKVHTTFGSLAHPGLTNLHTFCRRCDTSEHQKGPAAADVCVTASSQGLCATAECNRTDRLWSTRWNTQHRAAVASRGLARSCNR